MITTLRERLRRLRHTDRGTTLMELVVAMSLMSVFLGIFTTSVFIMTSSTNKVDSAITTAGSVNTAYLRLDKLIRYASAISTPGTSSGTGDWYVEVVVPGTSNTSTCTQLRVDITAKQLQQRSWSLDSSQSLVGTVPTTWTPLASSITNGNAAANTSTTPFVISTSSASLVKQLTVNLVASTTSPASSTANSSVTFSAMNSTTSSSSSICGQGGRP